MQKNAFAYNFMENLEEFCLEISFNSYLNKYMKLFEYKRIKVML